MKPANALFWRPTLGLVLVASCIALIAFWRFSQTDHKPIRPRSVKIVEKRLQPAFENTSSPETILGETPQDDLPKTHRLPVAPAFTSIAAAELETNRRFKSLRSKLNAIEGENLELVIDLKRGDISPTVYVFRSPSDEQFQRMYDAYREFASSAEGDENGSLKAAAIELVNTYIDYPAPYKMVTMLPGSSAGKIGLMEGFTSDISKLDQGGYADTVYSSSRFSNVSPSDWAVQRYAGYEP